MVAAYRSPEMSLFEVTDEFVSKESNKQEQLFEVEGRTFVIRNACLVQINPD